MSPGCCGVPSIVQYARTVGEGVDGVGNGPADEVVAEDDAHPLVAHVRPGGPQRIGDPCCSLDMGQARR
jgi:hypothetical protein